MSFVYCPPSVDHVMIRSRSPRKTVLRGSFRRFTVKSILTSRLNPTFYFCPNFHLDQTYSNGRSLLPSASIWIKPKRKYSNVLTKKRAKGARIVCRSGVNSRMGENSSPGSLLQIGKRFEGEASATEAVNLYGRSTDQVFVNPGGWAKTKPSHPLHSTFLHSSCKYIFASKEASTEVITPKANQFRILQKP